MGLASFSQVAQAQEFDLDSFIEKLRGPEWIGPWYSEMIANRGGAQPVQPHPQYDALPSYPAWTWIEGTDQGGLHRVASPGGTVTQVGPGDYDDLAVSGEQLGTPVVGIITDFGGVKHAFDILEMSATGWMGHMINMPDFRPSLLHAGRAVAENIDAKVYSFVYDEIDRVYLSYRSTLPSFTDQLSAQTALISSDDPSSLKHIDDKQVALIRELQAKIEANEQLMGDLQIWLDKNYDKTTSTSLQQLIESKELNYPEIAALLKEGMVDFVIADKEGKLAPEAFIQYPLPAASWYTKPLDLNLGMVAASHSAQPRSDLFIFAVADDDWMGVPKKIVVTTHCQLSTNSGYLSHVCSNGAGFFPLHFDPSSDVALMNSSSVPGWLRQAIIERPTSGSDRVVIVKNEVMSDSSWYEPRAFVNYVGQGAVSSASVLSLNEHEYMLAVVEDSELKIFLVNDQHATPVFEPWPGPVSAAQSFQSVDLYREGDAMVMVAVTTDNQIWKFMANVPGTIWTP